MLTLWWHNLPKLPNRNMPKKAATAAAATMPKKAAIAAAATMPKKAMSKKVAAAAAAAAAAPISDTLLTPDEINNYIDTEMIPFAQNLLYDASTVTKFGAKLQRHNTGKRWINIVGSDGQAIFARIDVRDSTLYTPCGTKPICSLTDSYEWSRRMTATGLKKWDTTTDKSVVSAAVITVAEEV